MTLWIAAAFLVVGFLALAKLFRLVEKSGNVFAVSQRSLAIIRNSELSDDAKEAALQENAKRLFALAFLLTLGAAAAVLAPMGLLWLCDRLGWISLDAVSRVALSPAFIIASCALVLVPLVFSVRSKQTDKTENYSALDRLLHRVAFKTTSAQIAVADIEDRLFAKQLAACKVERPVFITSLPRAGTTMLLELCAGMTEFASHCYRDMPFVLVPCLWNRFSASFRKNAKPQERAHGDGMLIDFDSPEALEEVLWQAFWRRHYAADRIAPWKIDEDRHETAEFNQFFRAHMRKVMLVRRGPDAPTTRYLSKNNLNIARTALLRKLFPDAVIVVPFREPLQHVASLLKQHRNFLDIHKGDRFASDYMRAIGHYEFGDNLRPVDFDGWFDRRRSNDAESLAFWLEYWATGYRHLLGQDIDLRFIDYDALCENPEQGLRRLADAVECREPDTLLAAAANIHAARARNVDVAAVPQSLLDEVDSVYSELKARADALVCC
jgi:hypothetical protein